jgi:hypothetical protein
MIQLLKASHPAHKPAARQASSGQSGERPSAPWISDEVLARSPEEQLLKYIRVLRDALEYVEHKVEAAQEPQAEDLGQDRGVTSEEGAMTQVRAIGEEAGGEHSAHGSESAEPDTAAGPAPMPSGDARAMPDGGPLSNAPSVAHCSGDDPRDNANGRNLIPRAPDHRASGHTKYSGADWPLGPGDCTPHMSLQRCQKCGATVKPVHMMLRVLSGFFCPRCCPACRSGG